MPTMSLSTVSASLQEIHDVAIALNVKLTAPPVGTHLRNLDRVNGRTYVSVQPAFFRELGKIHTVQELKLLCERYIRLNGERFDAKRFLILDAHNRTMNAARNLPQLAPA